MITSPSNPLVKELVRLRDRRHRDAGGRFVIEGRRQVVMAVQAGVDLQHQIVCPELGGSPPSAGVATTEMSEAAFRRASIRQNPDGVMAVAAQLGTGLAEISLAADPLLLVVESIEKPGNLGAMLRTCDALGVDAVIVADPTVDLHNPNVVQASRGALFTVSIAAAATDEVLAWLRRQGVGLVATTPERASSLWEADLTGAAAIAVGAESTGLSHRILEAADQRVVIPMQGTVDSLNASVAAAVVLYEAARQRRVLTGGNL